MYGRLPVARSDACTRDALAANVIDVMEDDEVRLICGRTRATHERSGSENEAESHTI